MEALDAYDFEVVRSRASKTVVVELACRTLPDPWKGRLKVSFDTGTARRHLLLISQNNYFAIVLEVEIMFCVVIRKSNCSVATVSVYIKAQFSARKTVNYCRSANT